MSAVHQKVHALAVRFLLTLPGRVESLARTLAGVHDGQEIGTLARELHSLAGTAGTLGLHDIASLAAEGESVCGDGHSIGEDDLQYLGSIVDDIQQLTLQAEGAVR